jgi:hypothetical protein
MEKRRLKRTATAIPALLYAEGMTLQGEILSISKKGLFVHSMNIPSKGTVVRVVLKVPGVEKIEVSGHVRWTTDQLPPGTYRYPGFGMLIDEWSEDFHEFFERMLFS